MTGGTVGRRGPQRLPGLRGSCVASLAANKERGVFRVIEWSGPNRCRHEHDRAEDAGPSQRAAGHRLYPTALGMRFTASGKPVRSAPPALNV